MVRRASKSRHQNDHVMCLLEVELRDGEKCVDFCKLTFGIGLVLDSRIQGLEW